MKRAYDKEARQAIEQLLRNAIKAVKAGLVNDPGDLGQIAGGLNYLAMSIAESSEDDPQEAAIWFSDWCAFAEPYQGAQNELQNLTGE
ncbi:MAG TPA: hypothetical protein VM260_22890 [Pirellula sp.]|nr:hypothetical protein [Pirellula sp.]